MKLRWIPVGIFLLIGILLAVGLTMDPRLVPSPLVGRPAPEFSLPHVKHPERTLSRSDLLGQVSLFNVWASWCQACLDEHPVLLSLQRSGEVPIYGLNYKDTKEAARRWLDDLGDPYVATGFDNAGRVGIEWGVYGVPETYVVDAQGVIRHKHIGALTWETVAREILPLVRELGVQGQAGPAGIESPSLSVDGGELAGAKDAGR